jgi:Ca2+-binding EF-hand superfamily protein
MSGGKGVIVISEITDPRRQGWFQNIAQAAGATNGQLTKDQFITGFQQMRSNFSRGRGGPQQQGPGPGPSGTPGPGGQAPAAGTAELEQQAELDFRRRDRNGDGVLNEDEMPRSLQAEWRQWDKNGDGVIDLQEYKAYYVSRMQQRQQNQGSGGAIITDGALPIDQQEEKKAPVYRAGKLPKGIPAWFEQLDTDKDGQIGLYEWKRSGKPIELFLAMDRNKDGFLTIQEVMRYEKLHPSKPTNPQGTQNVASDGSGAPGNSANGPPNVAGQGNGPPNGGGQGQGGMGNGQPNWGGPNPQWGRGQGGQGDNPGGGNPRQRGSGRGRRGGG